MPSLKTRGSSIPSGSFVRLIATSRGTPNTGFPMQTINQINSELFQIKLTITISAGHQADGLPGFYGWEQPSLPQGTRYTRKAMPFHRRSWEDCPLNQHPNDRSHESEQQTARPNTTR